MTRWLDYAFIIWTFKRMKICPKEKRIAKAGSQFSLIVNKPSKDCQKLFKFCQNGEI